MHRRDFILTGGGLVAAGSLAGCSTLAGTSSDETPNDSNPTPTPPSTPKPEPQIEWIQERAEGGGTRLTVSVELDGAPGIKFVDVDTEGKNEHIATIRSSGNHTIAGPNAPYPPITEPVTIHAGLAGGDKTAVLLSNKIDDKIVGGQPTRQAEQPAPQPEFLHGLSGNTLPNTSNSTTYTRKFTQTVRGSQTDFTLSVLEALYKYYKSRPRVPNYAAYTSDFFDNESIESLSQEFEDYGEDKDQSARRIADHAIAWVQGMKYTQDKAATGYNEYPKYPLETIVDRGGDCEDTAILLAEVLRDLGYGTVLLKLDQASHMAVGVSGEEGLPGSYYTYQGDQYYYVETTGSGWRVGEVPDRVRKQGSQAEILEINRSPSLAVQWKAFVPSSGGVEMKATGHNVGEATATNAKIQIDIVTTDGRVVAQSRKSLPSIQPQGNATKTFQLKPPADRALRIRVGVLSGGVTADVDESPVRGP